jgi:hypothetical protein
MNDVIRGLRQALVMLIFSAVVALVVAGLWSALQGGGFRLTFAIVLMVIAGFISFSGGAVFSRAMDTELGFVTWRPEREDPDTGTGLTGLGVFLFVSLPLFIAGSVLFGSG